MVDFVPNSLNYHYLLWIFVIIYLGYDVCGLYGCPSFELSSNIEYKELQEFLYAAGIVIKINPPEYKHYSALTARLDTFKKWDINEKPDIQTLCEAGFFYSGKLILFN